MTTKRRVFFHIMSSLILLGSLLYGFLYVRLGLLRLIETGRDFGLSIATWFSHVVGIDFGVAPTVGLPSKIDFSCCTKPGVGSLSIICAVVRLDKEPDLRYTQE